MKKTFIAFSLAVSLVTSNALATQSSTQETQQLRAALDTLARQVQHTCVAKNEASCSSANIQIAFPTSKSRAQEFMNNLSKAGVEAELIVIGGSTYKHDTYQRFGEKAKGPSAIVVFRLPSTGSIS